jgi:hypothetical protein
VLQLRQAPQTVQNVVTYDVVIGFNNQQLLLKPGMTATVRIITARRDDALRVPDLALRFTPGGPAGTQAPEAGKQAGKQVWVLRNHRPERVAVKLGLDDETNSEVLDGDLKPGGEVIIGEQRPGQNAAGPFRFGLQQQIGAMAQPLIETRDLTRVCNQGVTVIVVTHEKDIADYADRIITMRDGRIVSDEKNLSASRQTREAAPLAEAKEAKATPPAAAAGASLGFTAMIFGAAAQAIGRNKLRAMLTMLGVFIGVAALIAMVAVGQGANQAVREQIESLGTNLLVVLPGATTAAGVRQGFCSASTLTVADAQAILREDPAAGMVSYMIRQLGQTEYGSQNWTTNIAGVTRNYLVTGNWGIAAGRGFGAADEDNAAMVALIGETVRRETFGESENPIGAMILVKGMPVRVIGLLAAKGQSAYGQDQDDVLMIPFTIAERKVLGVAAPVRHRRRSIPIFHPWLTPMARVCA